MKPKVIEVEIPNEYVIDNTSYCNGKMTISLKEKPIEAGDIVVFEVLGYKEIAIVGNVKSEIFFDAIVSTTNGIDGNLVDYNVIKFKRANEDERAEMMQYLSDNSLKWNEENNTIKKLRWRADYGCEYWFVNSFGKLECIEEENDSIDKERYSMGNYFRAEEEAKASKFYKVFHENNE